MKNQLKKTLSIVLMACMLLSAVPVWAAPAEDTSTAEVPQEQTLSTSQAEPAAQAEEVTVLWEDETLRGEYEKHFLMSDGSYQAVVYSYPVHELVDGVWVEMESTNQNARGDVTASRETTNILDNFVWEGHGVQSSTGLRLYIGSRSGYTARTYIQFATMPTIPAGSTITAATMKLTMVSGTSLAYTANAYQVTGGEWTPTTIQWTNKPAANVLLASNISNNDRTKYQFSVLTAVRHWYDGDPTGQNENYGIMLRYYDESLTGYYNSVYSGDVVDTNSRPKLTISYTPPNNEVSMLVGKTRTLTVSDYTGTITWTSSDPSVASVSSSGVVTSVKVGSTTVTAYGSGNELKVFKVYVKIQDGVYYIKNSDDLCIGTNGSLIEGTNLYLKEIVTSGREQLNQLWMINYLSGGYYCIRPLYNMNMALRSSSGYVTITTIGDSNLTVPGANKWTIEYGTNGCLFKCAGTSSLTMRCAVPYENAFIVTETYSSSTTDFDWTLERVTSITNQLLLLNIYDGNSVEEETKYIEFAKTRTLSELGIAASFVCSYSTNQSISWSSLNPSVVSVDASTGAVTGLVSGGEATIVAKHIHNGIEYKKNYYVQVLVADPFEPEYIEYMRQTRIVDEESLFGTTDFSITIIKSQCSPDPFCTITDYVNDEISRCYVISNEQKNQLDTLEDGYQDGYSVLPALDTTTEAERMAHLAKGETDQLVDGGHIETGSDEYYGAWTYNYISMFNLGEWIDAAADTASKAYGVYISLTTYYYSWLAASNTKTVYVSSSQYDDIAAYIDGFDYAAYSIDFSDISFISAEERNLALAEQGYTTPLPYKEGTPVLVGKVSNCSTDVYVRVYTEGTTTQDGRWFMRYSDIQGLTAEEIRGKFALGDRTPTHYSFVTVPEGKTVYVGVVNQSTVEGTIQFEILERAEIGWYGESIPLP